VSGPGEDAGPLPGVDPAPPVGEAEHGGGFVPPDPDEPPPVEIWRAVGDVLPWGTMALLFSWALVFLVAGLHGDYRQPDGLFDRGASAIGLPWRGTAWRLLACTFLHAGAAHLFFNATSLLVVGQAVERIFTRWRFVIVFVIGSLVASAASLAWRARLGEHSLGVGGSGAVFALGGALLVAALRLRRLLAPTRARALAAALLYLIAPGFAAGWAHPGTDNIAHAGGLACGAVLGAVMPLDPRLGGTAPAAWERVVGTLATLALLLTLVGVLRG
jgi:rhomboid protease GluP